MDDIERDRIQREHEEIHIGFIMEATQEEANNRDKESKIFRRNSVLGNPTPNSMISVVDEQSSSDNSIYHSSSSSNNSKDSSVEKVDTKDTVKDTNTVVNTTTVIKETSDNMESESSNKQPADAARTDTQEDRLFKSNVDSNSIKSDVATNASESNIAAAAAATLPKTTGILINNATETSSTKGKLKTSFQLTTSTQNINEKPGALKSPTAKPSGTPLRSLMDLSFDFTEPEQIKTDLMVSLDNLPQDMQYETLAEFHEKMGTSPENPLVPSTTATTDKWPTPTSIEHVRQLCDTESAEGTPQSQLALCLHLMESAYIADPENNKTLPQEGSGLFEDIMARFKKVTAPTTLAEALVFESKKLLKQLANGGKFAGEGGDGEAQYLLGSCYGMGALGWPINHRRAFQWYLQASKNDHPEAIYRTGVCYELGLGTEKNGASAIQFFKKAAMNWHVPSMYKLGIIYLLGLCGAAKNKRAAVTWLHRAAYVSVDPFKEGETTTIGNHGGIALPQALHALASIYLDDSNDTSVICDPAYAYDLFQNSARFGFAPSQYKLGEYYEHNDHFKDNEQLSLRWYALAAKQGFPEACLRLSHWYLTGSVQTNALKQDDAQAFAWAQKAADLSKSIKSDKVSADIYFALGNYHERGIGTEISMEKAKYYYQKAAKHSHPEAKKMTVV